MTSTTHQFVDRRSGELRTEKLFSDRLIRFLYSSAREHAPTLFRALTGSRASRWMGLVNYDLVLGARLSGNRAFLRELGVDLSECIDPPSSLRTARSVFERKIRYWECRPMPANDDAVVSPADARVLVGSLAAHSRFWVKDKFFAYEELLGLDKPHWLQAFRGGDFAVFRLTPDKYHYNHAPVSGFVCDQYELDGVYHSCNPGAVVTLVTPYSKNKRVVTVINTDVPGGSRVGLVAMIEVVAMMIGEVRQCYSADRYDEPQDVQHGLFIRKGQPKSLYRPGSSTDILLFQPGRVSFADDLVSNLHRPAMSRFSQGFGQALVETDVQVRSLLAWRNPSTIAPKPSSTPTLEMVQS